MLLQDEALSGAPTQLYGWTTANFPKSQAFAKTSGCEVKGELGGGEVFVNVKGETIKSQLLSHSLTL